MPRCYQQPPSAYSVGIHVCWPKHESDQDLQPKFRTCHIAHFAYPALFPWPHEKCRYSERVSPLGPKSIPLPLHACLMGPDSVAIVLGYMLHHPGQVAKNPHGLATRCRPNRAQPNLFQGAQC